VLFLLVIVLSVFLQFADSDYPFGNFLLFFVSIFSSLDVLTFLNVIKQLIICLSFCDKKKE